MSSRLPKYHEHKRRYKTIDKITSEHYNALIDHLLILDEYLISVFAHNNTMTPLLEFTFRPEGDWGVEKFVKNLLYQMEDNLKLDKKKLQYSQIFKIPYNQVNANQRRFYKNLLK